jgi:hypothetical protein
MQHLPLVSIQKQILQPFKFTTAVCVNLCGLWTKTRWMCLMVSSHTYRCLTPLMFTKLLVCQNYAIHLSMFLQMVSDGFISWQAVLKYHWTCVSDYDKPLFPPCLLCRIMKTEWMIHTHTHTHTHACTCARAHTHTHTKVAEVRCITRFTTSRHSEKLWQFLSQKMNSSTSIFSYVVGQ